MHELSCPNCNNPSQFDITNYLLLCPICSSAFNFDIDTGQKEIFQDHYIIPNIVNPNIIEKDKTKWLKKFFHKPEKIQKNLKITKIKGFYIPYWIVSLEAHSSWKGMSKKSKKSYNNSEFVTEKGVFERSYRWCILARSNILEIWGLYKLHQDSKNIKIEWDGFPLDSTFSRNLFNENNKNLYKSKTKFKFEKTDGLEIKSIQIDEKEAIRRTKEHIHFYHQKISNLYVDILIDYRTEIEIASIQIFHLPFWHIEYTYNSKINYFFNSSKKNILFNGFNFGVLKEEMSLNKKDKILISNIILSLLIIIFFLLSLFHIFFLLISILTFFVMLISIIMYYRNAFR